MKAELVIMVMFFLLWAISNATSAQQEPDSIMMVSPSWISSHTFLAMRCFIS